MRPALLLVATTVLIVTLYLLMSGNRADADRAAITVGEADAAASEQTAAPLSGEGDEAPPDIHEQRSAREQTLTELANTSESFRNTTLLLAIHDAGFVCEVVAEAIDIGSPVEGWRVECPRAYVYSVGVGLAGELEVAPTLSSFDSIVPVVPPPR